MLCLEFFALPAALTVSFVVVNQGPRGILLVLNTTYNCKIPVNWPGLKYIDIHCIAIYYSCFGRMPTVHYILGSYSPYAIFS